MKQITPLLSSVCIAALALCTAPQLSAKGKASPTPAASATASPIAQDPSAKPARAIPFHGKVESVDATAKTFTIAGKASSRVFKVTDATVIMKQDAPATMADIVADEEVRGSYWKKEDGSLEAKKVKLGPKSDAEKARKRSKKEKSAAEEPTPTP